LSDKRLELEPKPNVQQSQAPRSDPVLEILVRKLQGFTILEWNWRPGWEDSPPRSHTDGQEVYRAGRAAEESKQHRSCSSGKWGCLRGHCGDDMKPLT
jgi:hypothetical protein